MRSKIINVGDVFQGRTQTDIVNQVFDKNYKLWLKSYVLLDKYGKENSFVWFAKTDGKKHGHRKNYEWRNILLNGDDLIVTNLVSSSQSEYISKRMKNLGQPIYFFILEESRQGLAATYKGVYKIQEEFDGKKIVYAKISKESLNIIL